MGRKIKNIVRIESQGGEVKIVDVPKGTEVHVFDHDAKAQDPKYQGTIYEHESAPEFEYDWNVGSLDKKLLDTKGDEALAELDKTKIDMSKLVGFVIQVDKVSKK